MKKADLLLISVILALAVVCFIALKIFFQGNKDNLTVVVYTDGGVMESFQLSGQTEYVIRQPEGYNVLKIEGNTAKIIESNCSEQVCVHTGKIKSLGETIVCLPHRVMVKIDGNVKN